MFCGMKSLMFFAYGVVIAKLLPELPGTFIRNSVHCATLQNFSAGIQIYTYTYNLQNFPSMEHSMFTAHLHKFQNMCHLCILRNVTRHVKINHVSANNLYLVEYMFSSERSMKILFYWLE